MKEQETGIITGSRAAHKIRKYISENNLKPGDRLPTQAILCQYLNLGIRAFREGISILVQHGILETRRKGGTLVKKPSIDELSDPIRWHLESTGYSLDDLVQARAAIESAVAAIAAQSRTARDLLIMLDELEKMENMSQQDINEGSFDQAFHLAILNATHNPVMSILGELIVRQFRRKMPTQRILTQTRLREVLQEHQKIYQAIEAYDSDTARDTMYEHIMRQNNQ